MKKILIAVLLAAVLSTSLFIFVHAENTFPFYVIIIIAAVVIAAAVAVVTVTVKKKKS